MRQPPGKAKHAPCRGEGSQLLRQACAEQKSEAAPAAGAAASLLQPRPAHAPARARGARALSHARARAARPARQSSPSSFPALVPTPHASKFEENPQKPLACFQDALPYACMPRACAKSSSTAYRHTIRELGR